MIARGAPIVSLAVGQPSAPVPDRVRQAALAMLEGGRVGYTDALGTGSLRERIARHYRETYGVDPGAERIMVTTGSSAGFNLAFLAAFDPGDRVALAAPGYPAYRNILKAMGLVPVEIEVGAADGYVLTAEHLREAHRETPLAGVLVASPANPTGTVTPRAELAALVAFCEAEDIRFVSDEIYHGLVYGEPAASALEFSNAPIVVNSFSKYYLMTGWRIGWLVLPPSLLRAAERIGQSLYISAPALSQTAAEAALDASAELDMVRATYERNRTKLISALPEMGFGDIAPIDGAFYAYAHVPERYASATDLCRSILHDAHVAMTPGLDFDLTRGEQFVRLSYACDETSMDIAIARLRTFFDKAA